MAQAFVTTYRNHYKWNTPRKLDPCLPVDTYNTEPLEGEMWYKSDDFRVDEDDSESIGAMEERLRLYHKTPVQTVYQKSYCRERNKHLLSDVDNELLEYCKNLYDPEPKKILPPTLTTRRFLGHLTASNMLIPLTCYQSIHGFVGYKIMDDNVRMKNNEEGGNSIVEEGDEGKDTTTELKDLVKEPKIKDILERVTPKKRKRSKSCQHACGCSPIYYWQKD